jgi:hypothetical protein
VEPKSVALDLPAPRHPVDVGLLVRCTQDLLASGVPLTLLIDLADEQGPNSQTRYAAEGGDVSWVPR